MIAAEPAPGFWRSFWITIAKNPISLFAVFCVAATAAFLGFLTYRLLAVLESPAWCAKAVQAERVTNSTTELTTCVVLLKIQLSAVATGFHISTGGFVFVLIVLIVVVVAGARASGKVGSSGLEFDVSRQDKIDAAADHVVEGAEQAAAEVKG